MAGIGFRLQALIAKGSYLEAAVAYLSSAVIATGPWLSGVGALLVLSSSTATYLSKADHLLFLATVITVFAASLFIASGPQLLVTRYLADRLYLNDMASVAPTCVGVLFLLIPLALLTLPFLLFAPFDPLYRVLVTTLLLTLTMIWMVAAFLSAAHAYGRIVLIFVLCYTLGCGASFVLGLLYGLPGSLAGFTLGQVLCLCLLLADIYQEFPSTQAYSLAYLTYLRGYWELLVIGMLYALGVWADNIIFWLSPQAEVIHGFYHLFPPYDTARFAVSLATIPASAIFLLCLETAFYRQYRDYYQFIRCKGTLSDLVRAREGMLEAARNGIITILKVQGAIALFLCVIASDLAHFIGLAPRWVLLLRVQLLAGTAHFIVFMIMLFLLYLDQRRVALLYVAMFTVCNIFLTLLSMYLGQAFYGTGYLGASIIGAIIGWFLLNSRLQQLEYLTFMNQPIG